MWLNGIGDVKATEVTAIDDPLPPKKGVERNAGKGRGLGDKDRDVWAVHSTISNTMSKNSRMAISGKDPTQDGYYINIPQEAVMYSTYDKSEEQTDVTKMYLQNDGVKMIKELQSINNNVSFDKTNIENK